MSKDILYAYGNCQVGTVLAGLSSHPDFSKRFEVRQLSSFVPFGQDDIVETARQEFLKDYKNVKVFLYQLDRWDAGAEALAAMLPDDCLRLPIFSLSLSTLWPFYFKDVPLLRKSVEQPAGLFPYGDSVLAKSARKGRAQKIALYEYFHMDVNSIINLDEWHETSIAALEQRESATPFRVTNFIRDNFRDVCLFWTPNHPTNRLIRHLVDQILDMLNMGPLPARPAYLFDISMGLGGSFYNPIHPAVARHFDLTYVDENTPYRHYAQNITFADWASLYYETALAEYGPEARARKSAAATPTAEGNDPVASPVIGDPQQRPVGSEIASPNPTPPDGQP